MTDLMDCPKRRCQGVMEVIEQGVLNDIIRTYYRCKLCGAETAIDTTMHDEPQLGLDGEQ